MKATPSFKPGDHVRCISPVPGALRLGNVYVVSDVADLGPPTALLTVREFPDLLFHPRRFIKARKP
jgi:hypothetical protein